MSLLPLPFYPQVKALKQHPDFTLSNPNRARSLVSVFGGNHVHFHAQSGEGYAFIADIVIELDALNPQVRLVIIFMTLCDTYGNTSICIYIMLHMLSRWLLACRQCSASGAGSTRAGRV